jgi:SAM-dependent methyltransferase
LNPQYGPEGYETLYGKREDPDSLVSLYARIHTPKVLAEYDITLDEIEALLPARGRLLDFACAAGYFYERALKRGWDAHGADLGEWCALAAERRGLSNMHIGSLKDMGFPPGHFDVVYAAQVLEHILNPQAELEQLFKLVRPGGLLYVTVPNYQCLSIVCGKDDFELNTPPQHVNYFIPGTLRRLMENCGAEGVRVRSGGGLKWENLFGRKISSDIAAAYRNKSGAVEAGSTTAAAAMTDVCSPPEVPRRSLSRRMASRVKGACYPLGKAIVYQRMKLGICLVAYGWRART